MSINLLPEFILDYHEVHERKHACAVFAWDRFSPASDRTRTRPGFEATDGAAPMAKSISNHRETHTFSHLPSLGGML